MTRYTPTRWGHRPTTESRNRAARIMRDQLLTDTRLEAIEALAGWGDDDEEARELPARVISHRCSRCGDTTVTCDCFWKRYAQTAGDADVFYVGAPEIESFYGQLALRTEVES